MTLAERRVKELTKKEEEKAKKKAQKVKKEQEKALKKAQTAEQKNKSKTVTRNVPKESDGGVPVQDTKKKDREKIVYKTDQQNTLHDTNAPAKIALSESIRSDMIADDSPSITPLISPKKTSIRVNGLRCAVAYQPLFFGFDFQCMILQHVTHHEKNTYNIHCLDK